MSVNSFPKTALLAGHNVPRLGQGTWYMGEDRRESQAEIKALQLGIDLGMSLIDTAEMYADGGAETVVGEAIASCRKDVFLVSKVLPYNASRAGTMAACERSLKRMRTEHIDLYLLHWRGQYPLTETLEAFERLVEQGKILSWGVSNFDLDDMDELLRLDGGRACVLDQVLYNLMRRGIEFDLLPQCREQKISVMAYSPIEQGRVLRAPVLGDIARRRGVSPAQVALSWVLRHPDVIAIPKAVRPEHVRQNRAAVDLNLSAEDMTALDAVFPPPKHAQSLEML